MARAFGRILSSIWDDRDFIALEPAEQRLYMFLISQSNLSHAGVLPVTLRRWAAKAKNLTAAQLEQQLLTLDAARFIVLDLDQEELMIRTFVRNDSIWKQPRMMGAMVSAAMEISSRKLRHALIAEIERIPVNELSDEPGKGTTPSVRRQVEDHIISLRLAFRRPAPPEPPTDGGPDTRPQHHADPEPDPLPEPPQDEDREPPADPLPQDHADPPAQGHPQGSYARARAIPLQTSPTDMSAGADAPDAYGAADPAAPTAQTLLAEWLEHRGTDRPSTRIISRVGKELKALIEEGIRSDDIRRGFIDWDAKGADPSSLPSFVNGATAKRRAQTTPCARVSATTRATQQGLAVLRQVAERDGVDLAAILQFPTSPELTA